MIKYFDCTSFTKSWTYALIYFSPVKHNKHSCFIVVDPIEDECWESRQDAGFGQPV
jgi:hypothetical protein